jgi:hypothetical protein
MLLNPIRVGLSGKGVVTALAALGVARVPASRKMNPPMAVFKTGISAYKDYTCGSPFGLLNIGLVAT